MADAPPRRKRTGGRPQLRIATPHAPLGLPAEFRRSGSYLEVTFHAPHIPERQFRHSMRSRYIVVWSEGDTARQHQLLILPERVDPVDYQLSFRNGVMDARIRRRGRVPERPRKRAAAKRGPTRSRSRARD